MRKKCSGLTHEEVVFVHNYLADWGMTDVIELKTILNKRSLHNSLFLTKLSTHMLLLEESEFIEKVNPKNGKKKLYEKNIKIALLKEGLLVNSQ